MMQLAIFGALDWGIVGVYILAVLGLGAWASRGQEDESTYFLGGRSMPAWAVTLSVVATALSAATYVGAPQAAFKGDLTYLILNVGGILGVLLVGSFIIPRLYAANTTTIYGVLGQRFGAGGSLAAGVTFLFGRLLASGARLFIAGIAFSVLLFNETKPSSVLTAIVVFGLIGTVYTCLGGIRAVIWTDTLQIVLVVGAAIASVVFLLNEIPLPLDKIVDHLSERDKLTVVQTGFGPDGYDWAAAFTVLTALAMTFQNAGSYGCDHDLVQRMMTTSSPWKASLSLICSQVIAIPVVLLFMVIGLLLSIYYGHPELMGANAPTEVISDSRAVYPQFLVNNMPTGLAGLAMAGMFAAAMSSLDSAINAMAASLKADVIDPLRKLQGKPPLGEGAELTTSRKVVAGVGATLVGFAILISFVSPLFGNDLLNLALGVMTFALSGLLGVFCAALFTRRGNAVSVVAALVTGAVTIVALQATTLAFPWWMAIASPLSFVVCCLGRPRPQGALPPDKPSDSIA